MHYFDGMYILIVLDQLETGLWGKSIGDRSSTSNEIGQESLTVSSWAVEALCQYTQDSKHPSIKKYLLEMTRRRDQSTGGFGLVKRFTSDHRVRNPFKVVINFRHTATHVKAMISVFQMLSSQAMEAIKYLIATPNEDGGWGLNPYPITNTDCLSTAHVLEAIELSISYGIRDHLDEAGLQNMHRAIANGMMWFASNVKNDGWIFQTNESCIFQHTTEVLRCIPHLKKYYPRVYYSVLENLIEISKKYGGGLPAPISETIDPLATSHLILALERSNEKSYQSIIKDAITALDDTINSKTIFQGTDSECWSILLQLCNIKEYSTHLNHHNRLILDNLIEQLRTVGDSSSQNINHYLPDNLKWLSDSLSKRIFVVQQDAKCTENIIKEIPNILASATIESEYDVALSFANENRDYANYLAKSLRASGLRVFYDEFEQSNLWGKNLVEKLHEIYSQKALYCILIITKHYIEKKWTKQEWQSIQSGIINQSDEYLLPIRLDNTILPGLSDTIAYIDGIKNSKAKIKNLIIQKVTNKLKNVEKIKK